MKVNYDDNKKLDIFSVDLLRWEERKVDGIDFSQYTGYWFVNTWPEGGWLFLTGGNFFKEPFSPTWEIDLCTF